MTLWTQSPYNTKVPDNPRRPASDPLGRRVKAGHYYWQGQIKIEDLDPLARRIADVYLRVSIKVVLWSATGLPPGLAISTTTGKVTGTPTTADSYAVIVTATDSVGLR